MTALAHLKSMLTRYTWIKLVRSGDGRVTLFDERLDRMAEYGTRGGDIKVACEEAICEIVEEYGVK